MCYDDNARPPSPPGANGKARGEDLILTATDGNRLMAYTASPEHPTNAQVIILPDVRGLHRFYKELALRFAETGITAIAIDYFGRTAGIGSRDDTFEYMPHVQQMKPETFMDDVRAALIHLRQGGSTRRNTFTVGFCMGGSLSFLSGTTDFDLSGVIGFYAGMSRSFGSSGTVLDFVERIVCPVLGLFGGADQSIPVSNVEEFRNKLNRAGTENEVVVYPGAPHSFFDRRQKDFASESADAWEHIQSFIASHNPA